MAEYCPQQSQDVVLLGLLVPGLLPRKVGDPHSSTVCDSVCVPVLGQPGALSAYLPFPV